MAVWKFTSTLNKFTQTRVFKSIIQNGQVYLAEILYGVLVGPWC